jgi:hypothetical protein
MKITKLIQAIVIALAAMTMLGSMIIISTIASTLLVPAILLIVFIGVAYAFLTADDEMSDLY